jgi:uncharacterized protein YndB with AHSA1/START domain
MKPNRVVSDEERRPAGTSAAPEPAERVLVIERTFDAPRSLVFKVWTEPHHLVHWYGPRGFSLPSCEVDLRPGGTWRSCMLSPEGREHWVHGVFREIVEPERLVFTWAHENEDGTPGHETLMTVTFADQGGKTKLTLHQAAFESVKERDSHRGGWNSSMDRLAEYLAKPDLERRDEH